LNPEVGPEVLKELNLVSVEVLYSGLRPEVPVVEELYEGEADLMPMPSLFVSGAVFLVPEPMGSF